MMNTSQPSLTQCRHTMARQSARGKDQRPRRTRMRHHPPKRPQIVCKPFGRVLRRAAKGNAARRTLAGKSGTGGQRGLGLPTLQKVRYVGICQIARLRRPCWTPKPGQQVRARLRRQSRQNPPLTRGPQEPRRLGEHQRIAGSFGGHTSPRQRQRRKRPPSKGRDPQQTSGGHASAQARRIRHPQ